MAKVRKTLVPYGTHQSPDGPVVVTPERVRRWVDTHNRMSAAGLKVPVPWGHQYRALPEGDPAGQDEELFRRARRNAGYVERLEETPEGLAGVIDAPGLSLDAAGNLIDPRAGTAINQVSVGILPAMRDGAGRDWTDFIGHVALTPYPVWADQDGFQGLALQPPPAGLVRLALSPGGFSMDGKDGEKPSEKTGKETPKPADDANTGLDLFGQAKPGNLQNLVAQLKAEMAGAGIMLPDHIDGSNVEDFLSHLLTGIATLKAAKQQQPAAPAPEPEKKPGADCAREEQPQAMYMGLNPDLYKTDQGYREYVDAKRRDAAKALQAKLDALPKLGCPPGVVARLKAGARGVRLSLHTGRLDGEAAGQIELVHETLSGLPEKARLWMAEQVAGGQAVEAPNPFDADHESNVKQKATVLDEMKDTAFPRRPKPKKQPAGA